MRRTGFFLILVIFVLLLSACQPIQAPAEMQAEVTSTPIPMVIESTDDVPRISLGEAKEHFDNGTAIFVDSRDQTMYEQEHIAGAIILPIVARDAFGDMLSETLPKDQLVIAYCT